MSSETSQCREVLSPFCKGLGLDIGAGGDAIVPDAITMDLNQPYCPPLDSVPQILRGDARDLSGFCDGVLSYIFSSHLVEDFFFNDLVKIIREWKRTLKVGGVLVINAPNQQVFLEHCARTGQGTNENHKEPSFSIETFKGEILSKTGPWKILLEVPHAPPYSFYIVAQKL